MKCDNCNTKNNINSKYCEKCGQKLITSETEKDIENLSKQEFFDDSSNDKSKSSIVPAFILFELLSIVLKFLLSSKIFTEILVLLEILFITAGFVKNPKYKYNMVIFVFVIARYTIILILSIKYIVTCINCYSILFSTIFFVINLK